MCQVQCINCKVTVLYKQRAYIQISSNVQGTQYKLQGNDWLWQDAQAAGVITKEPLTGAAVISGPLLQ